jgi:hypothetical protein
MILLLYGTFFGVRVCGQLGFFLAVKKGFLAAVARRESPEVKHE